MALIRKLLGLACVALLACAALPAQGTSNQTDGPVAVVHNGHPALEWKGPGGFMTFLTYVQREDGGAFAFHVWHIHKIHETPGHLYVSPSRVIWEPDPTAKYKGAPFAFAWSEITDVYESGFRADGRKYFFVDVLNAPSGRLFDWEGSAEKWYCKDKNLRGKACRQFRNRFDSWTPEADVFRMFLSLYFDYNFVFQKFIRLTRNVFLPLPAAQATFITGKQTAGDAAAQAGKLYSALQNYQVAFQALPQHWEEKLREPLRQKIIKLVLRMNPPPTVPQKAMQHEGFALAAAQEATGAQDLMRAAGEMEKALSLAPWWADGYKNVGIVLEKAGQYDAAARNLQLYLLAKPNASDAQRIQAEIYSLQYEAQHPPYLGLIIGDISSSDVKSLGLSDATGAFIYKVAPDGPAARAGLKQGDVIRTFNGQAVRSSETLVLMIRTLRAGSTVTLGIVRDGKTMSLPVQVAARP